MKTNPVEFEFLIASLKSNEEVNGSRSKHPMLDREIVTYGECLVAGLGKEQALEILARVYPEGRLRGFVLSV